MQSLTVLLKDKEESLRKSKELLRKSQQQGEESGKKMELDLTRQDLFEMNCNQVMLAPVRQGQELYDRLTNPKGYKIRSSIAVEKAKLEQEVQQLEQKVTELER